jgi:hypothetical protein
MRTRLEGETEKTLKVIPMKNPALEWKTHFKAR